MVDTFYAGTLGPVGPLVAWDGTNENDILTWINEVSSPSSVIVSVTATEVVFRRGANPPTTTIPLDGWVARGANGASRYASVGRYVTSDPNGRAETIDDLVIP